MSTEDVDRRKKELARALRRRAAELAVEPAGHGDRFPAGGAGAAGAPAAVPGGTAGSARVAFFASSALRSALLTPTAVGR